MAARFNEPRRSSDSSRCFPRRRHLLARTYTLASAAAPAHWPRAAGRGEAGRAGSVLRTRGRQVGVRGGSRPGGVWVRAPLRCGRRGRALGGRGVRPRCGQGKAQGTEVTTPKRPAGPGSSPSGKPPGTWVRLGTGRSLTSARAPQPQGLPRPGLPGERQRSGRRSPAGGDGASARSFLGARLRATPIAGRWGRVRPDVRRPALGARGKRGLHTCTVVVRSTSGSPTPEAGSPLPDRAGHRLVRPVSERGTAGGPATCFPSLSPSPAKETTAIS